MQIKYCSSCGGRITQPSKFCEDCGHQLPSSGSTKLIKEQVITSQESLDEPAVAKQGNHKLYILLITLAACVGIFVLLNMNNSPEKVAKKFVKNLYSLELNEVEKQLSPYIDSWTREELQEIKGSIPFLKQMIKNEGYTIRRISITEVDIEGDVAIIDTEVMFNNGEYENNYIQLEKHSGKWKVAYFDF